MRRPPEPEEELARELDDGVVRCWSGAHAKIFAQLLDGRNYFCYELFPGI
jgi:hypothetical protein